MKHIIQKSLSMLIILILTVSPFSQTAKAVLANNTLSTPAETNYLGDITGNLIIYFPIVGNGTGITKTFAALPADIEIGIDDCVTWQACKNATTANFSVTGHQSGTVGATLFNRTYHIRRILLYFNTSSIPANATIHGVRLRMYAGAFQRGNRKVHVVSSYASNPPDLIDFSHVNFVSGGSATLVENSWFEIPFNLNALSWITKGNPTRLALLHDFDLFNITPAEPEPNNDLLVSLAEDPTNPPSLVVEYSIP